MGRRDISESVFSLSAHALQSNCVTKLGDREEDASQAVLGGAMGHPSDAPKV